MKTLNVLALAGLMTLSGAAFSAQALERVRGTIEKADGGMVTIKTVDGATETVDVGGAKFAWVVKSSLDQIKDGVFIGTATKGENPMTALEVVLFPESMRGTGEGHYGWDSITDHTAAGGTAVKSSMTNGTVKADTAGASGTKTLTVGYGKDGAAKTIEVPPTAPIVAFEPADKAILMPGSKIFAVVDKAGSKIEGKLIAVGKDGLTPPM